jgi:hypothetical protein
MKYKVLDIDFLGNMYWYQSTNNVSNQYTSCDENDSNTLFEHKVNSYATFIWHDNNNWVKYWRQFSVFHRLDGPAVEYGNGTRYWYYKGCFISSSTQEEFERWLKLMFLL